MPNIPRTARYRPETFHVRNMDEAKRIILTPEDTTTEERWHKETPYLADEIGAFMDLGEQSLLLDYGCGIGRMAKELIGRHGNSVVGVDISPTIRQLAVAYVASERFTICPRPAFKAVLDCGARVDGALAIWSLQHCAKVEDDIALIQHALKPNGSLFVCNTLRAAVPSDAGWIDTGFDIKALLAETFDEVAIEPVSRDHTSESIAAAAFIGKYRKRPA
ncbi:MAG: class I SAM-dependent methyltransferase [Methyloligellaceae bacterium]